METELLQLREEEMALEELKATVAKSEEAVADLRDTVRKSELALEQLKAAVLRQELAVQAFQASARERTLYATTPEAPQAPEAAVPVVRQEVGLSSLPEEVLQRVLALVPLAWPRPTRATRYASRVCGLRGLLALRLVCRRWARAVLSPAVWRHRSLTLSHYKHPGRLLDMLPVVGHLTVSATYQAQGDLVALAKSTCLVRSLCLNVQAIPPVIARVKQIFDKQRKTLRKLDVTISHPESRIYTFEPTELLALVDRLKDLTSLELGCSMPQCGPRMIDPLMYPFRRLSSLTRLAMGNGVHPDTARALLDASKLTLRDVDCGSNDLADVVASTAALVRTLRVTWGWSAASWSHLRRLQHLDTLKIAAAVSEECGGLVQLLRTSPPRELHLELPTFDAMHFWHTILSMRRVTVLKVSAGCGNQRKLLPLNLPDVETLEVDVSVCHNEQYSSWTMFKGAWSDSTAPKLKSLLLHARGGVPYGAWVESLKAQRPLLKIVIDD